VLGCALSPTAAHSFCGFFVATGDAKLFNQASRVVLVRDGDRTVITMANDFHGEPKEFAIVIPVPTVLQQRQVHVGDPALVDHLDAYSAPRLVEYFDPDPCAQARDEELDRLRAAKAVNGAAMASPPRQSGTTVRIEAQYTVGEYDILILSARESGGLEQWLVANGYRIPAGAGRVLRAYLLQGMKFFVAKVNLKEQQKLGFGYLRPIQIAYESSKFMLPIRLGMVNADGPQELFVYALTRGGRVEATNYRTLKIASDAEIPEYVKDQFGDFYRDLFREQTRRQEMGVVFTEYAWDMAWCDPCASPPLSHDELRQLGVFWVDDPPAGSNGGAPATGVFLTRLHARYDRAHFPEDLVFQVTADRTNFQGRYIIRHEWKGTEDCEATRRYREELKSRRAEQARTLAALTGWDPQAIRARMGVDGDWALPVDHQRWWERLWQK